MNCKDQRSSNGSIRERRSWIERNAAAVGIFSTWLLIISVSMINTWALAKANDERSRTNENELRARTSAIHSVPAVNEKLEIHIQHFNEFKLEQRKANENFNQKLDYLIRHNGQ